MAIIRFAIHGEGEGLEAAEAAAHARCASEHGEWYGSHERTSGMTVWTWGVRVGMCVAEREMNGYDDSDFYMTFYVPETDEFREEMFATTRGWTYPAMSSKVDATPEVRAKYEAHLAARAEAHRAHKAAEAAARPAKGKTLKVVRGRKVPVGTVGECVWYGEGKRYGYSRWHGPAPMRVGLKTAAGEVHWTDAGNVEVVAA